jgi:hypothetical protein
MQDKEDGAPLDPYRDILGIDLPSERLTENLRLYAEILRELKKLRGLDLTEVHPAIVFDPTLGYDDEGEP